MAKRILYIILSVVILTNFDGAAFSFNLDSIAEMGKFPRFIVNTYRWGDKFFNGYDTLYVQPTGYKFNAKILSSYRQDNYRFIMPENMFMRMDGEPVSTIGAQLTYLAVSAGYDWNVKQLLTGQHQKFHEYRFGFSCMLFSAEFYATSNEVGTTIKRFGNYSQPGKYQLPFNGLNNFTWGIDAYYFFNHKKYSQAAAFNFSRIQRRSQGAWYLGFSYYNQDLDFNFTELPPFMRDQLPTTWEDYQYRVETRNYAVRVGYGYNWVFAPNWVLAVSESPIVGLRRGHVNTTYRKTSFSLYNRLKGAVVWNHNHWFVGMTVNYDLAIVNEKKTTYAGSTINTQLSVGYRFNLW